MLPYQKVSTEYKKSTQESGFYFFTLVLIFVWQDQVQNDTCHC